MDCCRCLEARLVFVACRRRHLRQVRQHHRYHAARAHPSSSNFRAAPPVAFLRRLQLRLQGLYGRRAHIQHGRGLRGIGNRHVRPAYVRQPLGAHPQAGDRVIGRRVHANGLVQHLVRQHDAVRRDPLADHA